MNLNDYIGNANVKRIVSDNIAVCKLKSIAFPHTLITGLSGMGKTALAHAIANTLGVPIIEFSGFKIFGVSKGVMNASDKTIIIIDEVHGSPKSYMEDVLYQYMDSNTWPVHYPNGMFGTRKFNTHCTIIGCTNEPDKLPQPFINRCEINLKLQPYNLDEMQQIIKQNINISITDDALIALAKSTKFIPRNATIISKISNKYAILNDLTNLTISDIITMLSLHGIDPNGLTQTDRSYIHLLYFEYNNDPTGIESIYPALGETKGNIIEVENYLIREGILLRTPKGRMLTIKGEDIARSMKI